MRLLRVIKTRKGKPLNLAELEPKVASLCKKFKITLLYLFGSYAKGNPGPLSDIDIAYLASKKVDILELLPELQKLFGDEAVDAVDLYQAPPALVHQILKKGKCLYAKDLRTKITFETERECEYFDTAPLRKTYFSYMLKTF